MLRRTLKTFFNATELPAQISKKYPISLSSEQTNRILIECSKSQKYTIALFLLDNPEDATNIEQQVEIANKYPQKVDRKELEKVLKEAEANRKFSIY
jgi:ABC-type oligopeptide transport system ATPase subunit